MKDTKCVESAARKFVKRLMRLYNLDVEDVYMLNIQDDVIVTVSMIMEEKEYPRFEDMELAQLADDLLQDGADAFGKLVIKKCIMIVCDEFPCEVTVSDTGLVLQVYNLDLNVCEG